MQKYHSFALVVYQPQPPQPMIPIDTTPLVNFPSIPPAIPVNVAPSKILFHIYIFLKIFIELFCDRRINWRSTMSWRSTLC